MKKIFQNKAVKAILGLILVSILILTAYIIYDVSTINKVYYKNQKNIEIPILTYHNIVQDESQIEFDYMRDNSKNIRKANK